MCESSSGPYSLSSSCSSLFHQTRVNLSTLFHLMRILLASRGSCCRSPHGEITPIPRLNFCTCERGHRHHLTIFVDIAHLTHYRPSVCVFFSSLNHFPGVLIIIRFNIRFEQLRQLLWKSCSGTLISVPAMVWPLYLSISSFM